MAAHKKANKLHRIRHIEAGHTKSYQSAKQRGENVRNVNGYELPSKLSGQAYHSIIVIQIFPRGNKTGPADIKGPIIEPHKCQEL